jgi:hypothetical protein
MTLLDGPDLSAANQVASAGGPGEGLTVAAAGPIMPPKITALPGDEALKMLSGSSSGVVGLKILSSSVVPGLEDVPGSPRGPSDSKRLAVGSAGDSEDTGSGGASAGSGDRGMAPEVGTICWHWGQRAGCPKSASSTSK